MHFFHQRCSGLICKPKSGVSVKSSCLVCLATNDKTPGELATARCSPVQWDESAFQSLVLDGNTKDVVKALVTNKVTNTVSTDLIRGKGSGLILLFHG